MELKLFIAGLILFAVAMFMLTIKKKFTSESSQKTFKTIYSWVDTGWTALIIASFLMFFFVQAFKIPSGSMRDTLLEGDHLFVNKFIYGFHIPLSGGARFLPIKNVSRGDIVVFQAPQSALSFEEKKAGITKDFIKRCIAVAGDKVQIKNKKLYVNDVEVNEPYVKAKDVNIYSGTDLADYQQNWEKGRFASVRPDYIRDNFGPVTVPAGHYMMLGDNRDYSFDSRFWGPLPDKFIKGKALFLYWPVNRWRVI
ncbi:signal peptidase I [Endomicrobium proavitum]|uniref:Signal peptidase I n=1 Tax=Endomicrobium proavitum TaxID=1408281 RepID=A0A0G3WFU0_9BACT|nr:signal peptidase I [Endomicrobium proavitum]AKL97476.1 Signal peptidase I [Endomicrobium proavitum]